jgi:hemerythrin-like domain-containing protein
MAVQIGSTSPDFSDPIRLLSDCHRRVEMFLGSLKAIGENYEILDDEGERALQNALRYFRQAAPKHTADEEESLFPRLRRLEGDASAALSEIDRLEADHRWAAPLHDEVESIGALWIADRQLSEGNRERFRCAVEQLQAMYSKHINIEDSVLFPVANQILPEHQKREIGLEMARRRNVRAAEGETRHLEI